MIEAEVIWLLRNCSIKAAEILLFTRTPSDYLLSLTVIWAIADALNEYGLKPKTENTIYVDPLHSTDVINKTQALIEKGFRFDGVICTSNRITTGCSIRLSDGGLIRLDRLNQSAVKLVGFEDLRLSEYGLFPVTDGGY